MKGGRGKKYCKGCGFYFDASAFQINDPYCPNDSGAVKRMQRLAKIQGTKARNPFMIGLGCGLEGDVSWFAV